MDYEENNDRPSWYHDPTKEDNLRREEEQWREEKFLKEQHAEQVKKEERRREEESRPRSSRKGGYRSASNPAATLAAVVGWLALIVSFLTFWTEYDYMILGFAPPVFALIVGVLGLAIGYAAKTVAGLLGLAGLVMVYLAGQTADGFQLKAVPLETWGAFALIFFVGLGISLLFGRD